MSECQFKQLIRRTLVFFLFFAVCCLLFTATARAAGEFSTSYNVSYKVSETGAATVEQTVKLINLTSEVYASAYSVTLDKQHPYNLKAYTGKTPIPVNSQDAGSDKTKIILNFPDSLAGRDKETVFTLMYDTKDIAVKHGRVWDIILPKIAKDPGTASYEVSLAVPASFGYPAYLKPEPSEKLSSYYRWRNGQVYGQTITAAFGGEQIYKFSLTYHLVNQSASVELQEIALPPDTAYQRIHFENITPAPRQVISDDDGNWLARYQLLPKSVLKITVNGLAGVSNTARVKDKSTLTNEEVAKYTKSDRYWESDDAEIIRTGRDLGSPEAIYNFAVRKLNYDLNKIKDGSGRAGAKKALSNPDKSVCMEFTDLFIALSRAAGIPAREINGFAYAPDSKLRPLSLLDDILHSWPQYWNNQKSVWTDIDPTWEKTTGGVDYFSSFDFNHLAFAIHGSSSNYPLPAGSYKTGTDKNKMVSVEPADQDFPAISPEIKILLHLPETAVSESDFKGSVEVINHSGQSYRLGRLRVSADKLLNIQPIPDHFPALMPPFGSRIYNLTGSLTKTFSSEEILITAVADDFQTGEKVKIQPFYYNNLYKTAAAAVLFLTLPCLFLLAYVQRN